MRLGYRMKKRSMYAYDKIIVPDLSGYPSLAVTQSRQPSVVKHHLKSILRLAACIVLVILIGVIAPRNTGDTAGDHSFTIVAYAAAPAPAPESQKQTNGYTLGLGSVADFSVSLQKNTTVSLPGGKIYYTEDEYGNRQVSYFKKGSKFVDYYSFFTFSGDNIESVTMSAEKGKIVAMNIWKLLPLYKTENGDTGAMRDPVTDSEKELLKKYLLRGETVTFPPDGFSASWGCFADIDTEISDTIHMTIKYKDGSTQNSVMLIGEDENGKITAILN